VFFLFKRKLHIKIDYLTPDNLHNLVQLTSYFIYIHI